MQPVLLFLIRAGVAAVWIVEGLWAKVLRAAPDELAVARAVITAGPLSPEAFLSVLGACETALGIAVLAGIWCRPLAWFQGALLLSMNAVGMLLGGGAIDDPLRLAARNLPLLLCIAVLAVHGPGKWALADGRKA